MARTGNKFALSGRVSLSDGISKVLRKAGRVYDKFARNLIDKNHIVGKSFRKLNRGISRGFKVGAMVGIASLTLGLGIAVREFVNFDQAIVNATAKFSDLKFGTQKYADTMDILRKKAREVGAETQFTATQAAQGLNQFAKMGFKSAEAMAVLKSTVDLATVAEEDFNETSRISSKLLGSMGLNSKNSGEKIKNLTMLQRALGIAVNMSSITLVDMFEALKTSAPIASKLGASMNQLVAVTAALGSSGIDATLASTAMKNIYGRMLNPTDRITARLEQLKLSTEQFLDTKGGLDIVKIMDKVGKATKNLTKVERGAVFFDLFGLRAVAGAASLADNLAGVQDILDELEGDKTLREITDEMRKGLLMQLQILASTALEKSFQFFDAFTANGKDGIQKLTEAIRQLDVAPMVKFTKTVIKLLGFVADNWQVLLSMAVALKAVGFALGIAEIAVVSFGVVLSLTPFGAALLALGLLAGAITLLIANYDDLDEAAGRANEALSSGTSKTTGGGQIPFSTPYGGGFNPFTYRQPRAVEQTPQIFRPGFNDETTPKPVSYTSIDIAKGTLDINFNGLPDGASVDQSGSNNLGNVKIKPVLQP